MGEAIDKTEKRNYQLSSELEQLEHYNQYLANKCREKILSLIDKNLLFGTKSPKQKPRRNAYWRFETKILWTGLCNAIWDFVGKNSASKNQIKKHYHKMSLLTHPDAGGDEEFFKTSNRANQILTNDAAREAYNIFGPDDAEKVMNNENW